MGMFSRQNEAGPAGQGKGARFSFIGPEMNVTGDIATGGDLHVDGKIDGAVEAGTLTLDHSARITGDILYETLSISSGADVEGRFKRRKGAGDGSSGARTEAIAKPSQPAPASLFAPQPQAAEAAE
ncbi:MAG: polymer-forming cytoskeletal protein [Alphaproteobacteria bacterium]|nr:polymer-forming cytoskeletal protein [Alphaproteobacteria bacterium]